MLSIRDIDVQYTKTGFGGLWGNKGCVAARMNAYGVSICIVNTHLTPHDQNLQSRVDEYNHIIKETFFLSQKETTLILYHEYVFVTAINFYLIFLIILFCNFQLRFLDWRSQFPTGRRRSSTGNS